MDTLTLTTPDDWHLHLRDDAALQSVVAASARQFARAIIMPNLKPPITTVAEAVAYRNRIVEALQAAVTRRELTAAQAESFQPLMTLYLTEVATVEEIRLAAAGDVVAAVKLYPAGATTNSDAGVRSIDRVMPVLEAMAEHGLPLLVHGEVVDPDVDLFDREAVFIDRVMVPLRTRLPELRIVFEHITTRQAVEYVRSDTASAGMLGATITPQHLLYNRNAIFTGGVRPHWYCLPVLKRETHRVALLEAATSGDRRFFLGTDSAPHARLLKEHASGCAGCYTAPHALELYASAFEAAGALDRLEAFASFNGPRFYRREPNRGTVTLRRESWQIPASLPFAGLAEIVPLAAGDTLPWRMCPDGRKPARTRQSA
ncbi:MAG: dihydroorotase [Lautropia sp.]|nr:dihydroorotase [Lautropia sp.]